MTDAAELLTQAIDQMNTIVEAVPTRSAHAPTPCTEFHVTELIDHVRVIADRAVAALNGLRPTQSQTWTDAYRRLRGQLDNVYDGTRIVEFPFGTMPVAAALGVFFGEFVTHSWDLATAIGRHDLLADPLASVALESVRQRIPRSPREHTPFAGVIDIPAEAPVYDQLAGWMGRDPS